MTPTKAFFETMAALCECFERDPSTALIEAYWIALQDLGEPELRRGAMVCMRDLRFMPRPADIRKSAGLALSVPVKAAEAWSAARTLIAYGGGTLADPIASYVVECLGGWAVLGNRSAEENGTWTRKEFLRLYEECYLNPATVKSLESRPGPRGGGLIEADFRGALTESGE